MLEFSSVVSPAPFHISFRVTVIIQIYTCDEVCNITVSGVCKEFIDLGIVHMPKIT